VALNYYERSKTMNDAFTVAGYLATVILFALIVWNTRRSSPRNTFAGLIVQLVVAVLVALFGALGDTATWTRILIVGFGASIAVATAALMVLRRQFLALRRRNDRRAAMRRQAHLN
jgi:uncharacterized membrane protein YccC